MKYFFPFLLILILKVNTCIFAQNYVEISKPPIDSTAIVNWPSLRPNPEISNDGKYVSYVIENMPLRNYSLIIQSGDGAWKDTLVNGRICGFSNDNKHFVCSINDTICILSLESKKFKYLSGVISFQQPRKAKGKWLAYFFKKDSGRLILYNVLTEMENSFDSVSSYSFENNGNVLLLKKNVRIDNEEKTYLVWVELDKVVDTGFQIAEIDSKRYELKNYNFDYNGEQLIFIVQDKNNGENTLWYFKKGMDKALIKVNNESPGMQEDLVVYNSPPTFSRDGRFIFFQQQFLEQRKINPRQVSLDVWHYNDNEIQSVQLNKILDPIVYTSVVSTEDRKIIRLEKDYEQITAFPEKGDYVVVKNDPSGDRFWLGELSDRSVVTNWLVNLKNGNRKKLSSNGLNQFSFSPNGKFLVYYNSEKQHNYYSYNLGTGKIVNISSLIPDGWLAYQHDFDQGKTINKPSFPFGIAGWIEQDDGLLVYDCYDVWSLDLTGNKAPVNITNGFGRYNHIKLRLTYGMTNYITPIIFKRDEECLLTAFNTKNKYNGFYHFFLNKRNVPRLITLGPWCFWQGDPFMLPFNSHSFGADFGMRPIKAKDADVWLIKRQSNSEAPNYFITKDFRHLASISSLQPHKDYNWVTAELVTWKQLDGSVTQGILYKPENFSPNKKYPVLFNYYEQLSHRLYQYPIPRFTSDNIDVAWFVSRGYLVFTPDIRFKRGKPGQSAYNTIVSAANWLVKLPYVGAKQMGINGHSSGGFLTNYLVTHTNLFAAAIEGAGRTDYISSSLQLTGKRRGEKYEHGSGPSRLSASESLIGASIWERPDLYLENSPILKAKNVTTPLIIFHSKVDMGVPWEQGVEFFLALQRLGKKVWMLQYDNQPHSNSGEAAIDFTKRITQFFDHFLKGAQAPKWMTKGIPARLKGIETGLELEDCKEVNQQATPYYNWNY